MEKTKIAVLVSGGGTNLQALIDARGKVLQSGEIVLVVSTRSDAYALQRAAAAGIPAVTVQRKGKSQQEFERGLTEALSAAGAEMLVLAGFMSILSADFTSRWPERIINIHPSLIPSFCGKGFYGLHVHEAALAYGVKVMGATAHYVNEVPDGGKIILQKAVEVLPDDTPETLQRRVMEQAEWVLLPQAAEMTARALAEKRN
ncbi:MAG: phosphoribosylglycinamide formyltransferase [Oscillospiraceae bacterium]|nr:phosphoribosylglycinamide formyltransferase [Oscillospiraceae bacterium]